MPTDIPNPTPPVSDAQRKKNRLQLIAIIGIVLIPVLASTIMFYTGLGMPSETRNNGVLIDPPLNLTDMELRTDAGEHWSWAESGKFRLLLLLDGDCDEICAERLYTARQLHVRLAKRSTSLERLLVQLDDQVEATTVADLEQSLTDTYPRLLQLRGDFYAWRERLQQQTTLEPNYNGQQLLLVDRRGNLIMGFNPDHDGQQIMTDVNFLIKSTQ